MKTSIDRVVRGVQSSSAERTPAVRALLVGPVVLALLLLARALVPGPDVTLLAVFVVLAGGIAAMATGSRVGSAVVLVLGLALFQPVTAREFAFNLTAIDSRWWRWWAFGSVLALGLTLVASVVVLVGGRSRRVLVGSTLAGLVIGVGLVPVFTRLAPQPGFGSDLSDAEIEALPVIDLLNYAYDPPVVTVAVGTVTQFRLDNPSDLPHTVTIDALDLEVYVPAERWAVLEIDGSSLAAGTFLLYCSVGDHRARGMQAVLEIS